MPFFQNNAFDGARRLKLPFVAKCLFDPEANKSDRETDQQIKSIHGTTELCTSDAQLAKTEKVKLFFAIYYIVSDNAFQKAANTWRKSIGLKGYSEGSVHFMDLGVKTELQFKDAWSSIYEIAITNKYDIVEGRLFVRASLGHGDNQGLEFQSENIEVGGHESNYGDSTLQYTEMKSLEVLPWHAKARLWIHGCNTGVERDGWSPAQIFANRQGVITYGIMGYAYFSEQYDFYDRHDLFGNDPLYLRAFKRRLNVKDGEDATGAAISEKRFLPCG
jgi:hypothetical protein